MTLSTDFKHKDKIEKRVASGSASKSLRRAYSANAEGVRPWIVALGTNEEHEFDTLEEAQTFLGSVVSKAGVRRVRTAAGAKRYKAPIGTPIVRGADGKLRALKPGSQDSIDRTRTSAQSGRTHHPRRRPSPRTSTPKGRDGLTDDQREWGVQYAEQHEAKRKAEADALWARQEAQGLSPKQKRVKRDSNAAQRKRESGSNGIPKTTPTVGENNQFPRRGRS